MLQLPRYTEVLRLLREAERSGKWPPCSKDLWQQMFSSCTCESTPAVSCCRAAPVECMDRSRPLCGTGRGSVGAKPQEEHSNSKPSLPGQGKGHQRFHSCRTRRPQSFLLQVCLSSQIARRHCTIRCWWFFQRGLDARWSGCADLGCHT